MREAEGKQMAEAEGKQMAEVEGKEELVPCHGAILRAVAKILIERWKAFLSWAMHKFLQRKEKEQLKVEDSPERVQLLQRVAQHEEEFFDWAIKSLM